MTSSVPNSVASTMTSSVPNSVIIASSCARTSTALTSALPVTVQLLR
jgi:hypothetical protein